MDPARLLRWAAGFYGVLLVLALAWRGLLFGENLLLAPPPRGGWGAPLVDFAWGLAAAAGTIALSFWLTRRTRMGEGLARALARVLGPLEWRHCLGLALVSGVAEEAFFRGALQARVGLLVASVLFALAHFVPRRELAPWCGFSFAAGLLLGGLFELTGNLIAPITAHVVINAVNLRLLVREFGQPD